MGRTAFNALEKNFPTSLHYVPRWLKPKEDALSTRSRQSEIQIKRL